MSALPQNVHDLMSRLSESSRHELELVRELSEAIRRADDQLLKEVRSVTMLHELRREAIVSELQLLAQRLCALPTREPLRETVTVLDQAATPAPAPLNGHTAPNAETAGDVEAIEEAVITVESPATGRAGDWRQAAQRIDAELSQYFGGSGPRH